MVVEIVGGHALRSKSDADGDGRGQLEHGKPGLHGRSQIRGVLGIFAALLCRQRVPEVGDGLVGFVVGRSRGIISPIRPACLRLGYHNYALHPDEAAELARQLLAAVDALRA
jgi:hypothetical protein